VAVRSGLGAGPAASWGPAPIQFGAGPAGELEVEARRAGDLLNEAGTSTEQPAKWADLAGVRFEPCAGPVRLSVRFRSDTAVLLLALSSADGPAPRRPAPRKRIPWRLSKMLTRP